MLTKLGRNTSLKDKRRWKHIETIAAVNSTLDCIVFILSWSSKTSRVSNSNSN